MTESNQSASSKLMRDVVALGKKYSESGFPNPNRAGCPNPAILRAMAHRDRHLTLEALPLSHIVGCSPCFQSYEHFRRISRVLRRVKVTAACLAVLGVLLVTARVVRTHSAEGVQRNTSGKQAAKQQPSVETKQAPGNDPFPVVVDLASFSPTRGDVNDDFRNKVHFPRKLLRVKFLLPIGLESGEYSIRLQNAAGTVIAEKRARGHMTDGVTSVEVNFDLTGSHTGNLTLMIRPPGLSWREFPAVIE